MTYGLTWRLPCQERIPRIKPTFRTVFLTLCAVLIVLLIIFTYYPYSSVTVVVKPDHPTYPDRPGQSRYIVVQNKSDLIQDKLENSGEHVESEIDHVLTIPENVKESSENEVEKLKEQNSVENDADTSADKLERKDELTDKFNHVENIPEDSVGDKVDLSGELNHDKIIPENNVKPSNESNSDQHIPDVSLVKLEENGELKQDSNHAPETIKTIHDTGVLDLTEHDEVNDNVDEYESQDYSEDVVSDAPDPVNISVDKTDTLTAGFLWNDSRLDILHMRQPKFDPKFKNPCWYEELKTPTPYENNVYATYSPSAARVLAGLTNLWKDVYTEDEPIYRLRCLPYFMIIGQPKCGTTDLFWKIAKHPDILTPPIKELHWWSRNRQGRRFSYSKIIPFEDYVDMFDQASINIEQRFHDNVDMEEEDMYDSQQHHDDNDDDGDDDDDDVDDGDDDDGDDDDDTSPTTPAITGEASVSLFWDNGEWMKYPENAGHTEPVYTVPNYIHHILPDVKMILMFRDPVERMYSDYLYFHSTNKSAEDFHSAVVYAVDLYTYCITTSSVRSCIYDTSLANKVRVRLRIGMYSEYMKDWLELFPLHQFYTLRLEDYSKDPVVHIEQIYEFLQMRPLSTKEKEAILVSPVSNVRKAEDKELGGMLDKTRDILYKFYKPYNEQLSQLLKDIKYLWSD